MAKLEIMTFSKNGLHTLLGALNLPGRESHEHASDLNRLDVVLVAIDFEHTEALRKGLQEGQNSQTGIAMLDTRDIDHEKDPCGLITTSQFVTGSPTYIANASKKFFFGTSTAIEPSALLESIMSMIPDNRNIILIGHAVHVELAILTKLGFDLTASNILGILDTQCLAYKVLGSFKFSLKTLLRKLHCPFTHLHSAGNDAHFTLRAALLLAILGCEDQEHELLPVLRDIALADIPFLVYVESQRAIKRERRKGPSRKQQSKTWSLEKQEEIRRERAEKKARAAVDQCKL